MAGAADIESATRSVSSLPGNVCLTSSDGLLIGYKVHCQFESHPLHHPVRQFSDFSENRSKSARVRAICDHAWTRRTPSAARIRRIQQNLSGRDLARSMDHRRKFACSWNSANLTALK